MIEKTLLCLRKKKKKSQPCRRVALIDLVYLHEQQVTFNNSPDNFSK